MSIYKEYEPKAEKSTARPILATPEDLDLELGTLLALITQTKDIIAKAEASRLAGKARFDSDVIKSARVLQARLDILKYVIDRYQAAVTQRNRKEH
jgi:hypothetical protein